MPPVTQALCALLLSRAIFGCAHGAAPSADLVRPLPCAPAGLSYALRFDRPGGPLHVRAELCDPEATPGSAVAFSVPDAWGGHRLDHDLRGFTTPTPEGATIPIMWRSPAPVAVPVDAAGRATLAYDLLPTARDLDALSRFAPLLSPERFFAVGASFLATPESWAPDRPATVHAGEGPWVVRASLPTATAPLSAWVDASFHAGLFGEARLAGPDRSTTVSVDPALTLPATSIADLTDRITASQATLLGPERAQATRVVVLRRADDPHCVSGSGRAGGFVLEIGDEVTLADPRLVVVVAHERAHALVGHHLQLTDDASLLWFKEGVADYVGLRAAAAAALVPTTAFFARLGRAIDGARRAEGRAGAASVPILVGDPAFYDTGFVAAALIDLRLRAAGTSLEAVLGAEASRPPVRLDPGGLRAWLADRAGDWAAELGDAASAWRPLPIADALGELGLDLVIRSAPAPWFGFAAAPRVGEGWWLDEVTPGSPADEAGLRGGTALATEPSLSFPSAGPTAGRATLWVRTDRAPRRVVVDAAAGVERSVALVPRRDADPGDAAAAFGLPR